VTTTITSTPSCFQVLATTSTITSLNQVAVCGTTQPPTTLAVAATGRKKRELADFIDDNPIDDEYNLIVPSKV
jgi:hypothetical protein